MRSSPVVQWLAVRNTVDVTSVPEQNTENEPFALLTPMAPTFGWPLPSNVPSVVMAEAEAGNVASRATQRRRRFIGAPYLCVPGACRLCADGARGTGVVGDV